MLTLRLRRFATGTDQAQAAQSSGGIVADRLRRLVRQDNRIVVTAVEMMAERYVFRMAQLPYHLTERDIRAPGRPGGHAENASELSHEGGGRRALQATEVLAPRSCGVGNLHDDRVVHSVPLFLDPNCVMSA